MPPPPPQHQPESPTGVPPTTWTTRRLLQWMRDTFTKKGLDAPGLSAELLMAHVLGCERLKLYLDVDRPASDEERATLRNLVARALNHEPVQYLVGTAWFFGLPMQVDKRVLIPRPSTETIVEHVLQHARVAHASGHPAGSGFGGGEGAPDAPLLIADVCTGSGCIAVALAKRLTGARIIASDISQDALDVAALNAKRHDVHERIDLVKGDLLDPILAHPVAGAKGSLDYFISNPPYIPDHEWEAVEPNVKEHEPHTALRAGADGMTHVRPLIANAPALLKPGALLLIEIASCTKDESLELARAHPLLSEPRIIHDHEGLARVLIARRAE